VHCFGRSLHGDLIVGNNIGAFEIAIDVRPDLPVLEEDLSDNVHKNWPDVTAVDRADLKVYGIATPNATIPINTNTSYVSTVTIHNNGPVAVTNAEVAITLTPPPGCTINGVAAPNTQTPTGIALAVNETKVLLQNFTINCNSASFHPFSSSATISINDIHVEDQVPSNDTATDTAIVTVTRTVNVDINQTVTTVPNPCKVLLGASCVVTLHKTIDVTGTPGTVDIRVVASVTVPTPDCYVFPQGRIVTRTVTVGIQDAFDETFTIDCVVKSNKTYTFTDTATYDDGGDPHVIGIHADSDSDQVTLNTGMDAVAVSVGVEDPNTQVCPAATTPFTPYPYSLQLVQSHFTPLRFCEEDDNNAAAPVIGPTLVPFGQLPNPATITHPNPLKRKAQINIFEKKVLFHEDGKWHCIGSRCSVAQELTPGVFTEFNVAASTEVWEFTLATGEPVCVVQETGNAPYALRNCWKDVHKQGMKIVWVEYDKLLQREVVNEIWWYQEDPMLSPPQWEEEILNGVPGFTLDALEDIGITYNPGGGDTGPDHVGLSQLRMKLLMIEPFDINPANDLLSVDDVYKYVNSDTDSDSVPDFNDNCPDDPNPDHAAADNDGIGDVCDDTPFHDVGVKDRNFLILGPAFINISDTNGRYMFIIAEIGNFTNHNEVAEIGLSIDYDGFPAPPCTKAETQILPGASVFLMTPNEQKFAVWRVRFECHGAGATPGSYPVTVTVNATVAQPPDGPAGHPYTTPANDSKSEVKVVVIQ
jgi:hypothetical protein